MCLRWCEKVMALPLLGPGGALVVSIFRYWTTASTIAASGEGAAVATAGGGGRDVDGGSGDVDFDADNFDDCIMPIPSYSSDEVDDADADGSADERVEENAAVGATGDLCSGSAGRIGGSTADEAGNTTDIDDSPPQGLVLAIALAKDATQLAVATQIWGATSGPLAGVTWDPRQFCTFSKGAGDGDDVSSADITIDPGQEGDQLLGLACVAGVDATDVIVAAVRDIDGVYDATAWLTAPAPLPIRRYSPGSLVVAVEKAPEVFRDAGIAIIPGAISKARCATLIEVANARIGVAEAAIARDHPDIDVGESVFKFTEIGSRGNQRFDLLFDAKEPALKGADAAWIDVVADVMDCDKSKIACQVSVVYSRAGAPHQAWHCDGAHQSHDLGWPTEARKLPAPYAVCVFVPLIDLTEETGFTQFWPGSHRHAKLVGFGPIAALFGTAYDGMNAAGSACVYDYRLMHRGMPNVTESTQRPLLQFLYHVDWYSEDRNYGTASLGL
jgi:ectoine hydroxylase-related dioxygenase (phytanoyl-CoA dioxygenase family)